MDQNQESKGATPEGDSVETPRPLAALRHRDFRLLWIATFVSNTGSWMQKVATS